MKDQRKKNRELIKFQSLHYMFNQIYELYLKLRITNVSIGDERR